MSILLCKLDAIILPIRETRTGFDSVPVAPVAMRVQLTLWFNLLHTILTRLSKAIDEFIRDINWIGPFI